MIELRNVKKEDASQVERIFLSARLFMRNNGNLIQWSGAYPARDDIITDAENGNGYVICDGKEILAYFAFILGDDPTYAHIDGAWPDSSPYGTLHRVASSGKQKDVLKICVQYCRQICPHIRVDTHERNLPMRNALIRLGFVHCGTIYIADGTPRMAFCLTGKSCEEAL